MADPIAVPDFRPDTTRLEVVSAALHDVQQEEGLGNLVEVARWVDAYLAAWERRVGGAAPPTKAGG